MTKFKTYLSGKGSVSFFASVLAILLGLFFGLVVMLISNPSEALPGFLLVLEGGFSRGVSGLGNVIYNCVPLIMTGLSVAFAFKTGLFNIGASGQFTVGAFTAIYIGVKWTWLPAGYGWVIAVFFAALAGAIWGLIPGLLKAFRNVNVVISAIMMNYVGMYLVNFLIKQTIYFSAKNQTMQPEHAYIPRSFMADLFPNSSANIGIFVALGLAVLVYIILTKTTLGYELKAVGMNRDASLYAGINEKRNIVLSMVIAGALAGIGGALVYLPNVGKNLYVVNELLQDGFNGIPVALLAMSNPLGVLVSALFIAHIQMGGTYLQIYSFTPEVISIVISVIIYLGALSLIFRSRIVSFVKWLGGKNA